MTQHVDHISGFGTSDERAFALVQEGASLIEQYSDGNDFTALERAEQRLREAISRDPDFPSALFLHAVSLEYLGDHQDAILEFRLLVDRHPGYQRDQVLFNLATSYLTRYDEPGYRSALPLFQELAKSNRAADMRTLAHASMAMVYAQWLALAAGRPEKAADVRNLFDATQGQLELAATVAPAFDPENWKLREAAWLTHNARGFASLYLGRHACRADGDLEAARELYERAAQEFEAALRITPSNLDVLANVATLLLYRWRAESEERSDLLLTAREICQRVVVGRPLIDFGYYRLGQIERRLGLFDDARRSFEKALGARFHEMGRPAITKELEMATNEDDSDSERVDTR